jgi:hypothetical protein
VRKSTHLVCPENAAIFPLRDLLLQDASERLHYDWLKLHFAAQGRHVSAPLPEELHDIYDGTVTAISAPQPVRPPYKARRLPTYNQLTTSRLTASLDDPFCEAETKT